MRSNAVPNSHPCLAWVRMLLALVPVIALLALPASTPAKISCQERGPRGSAVEVSGLPTEPVAGRTYAVTFQVGTEDAIHRRPRLAVMHCGRSEARLDANELFRWIPASIREGGRYGLDLRFTAPGRWALSVFDRSGQLHDAGLHHVLPAGSDTTGRGGPFAAPAGVWAGAAAALGVGGGAIAFARRRGRAERPTR